MLSSMLTGIGLRRGLFLALPAALAIAGSPTLLTAQETSTNTPPAETDSEDEVVVLSPFEITTSKDSGYRATNSISGTRLNTEIKDLPMPIEVITEEFLRDTGSNDLRQSLRYSSGLLIQSQNDYGAPGGEASQSPGKVNNPEGLSASPYQTSVKIRGFQTDSVLRDGFRRRHATDSVNIARVEVVRGPASLLYGVGNFGGVVNYLVKQPQPEFGGEVSLAFGSYDFKRTTIDVTGPITESGSVAYRVTGAYQDTGSFTDFDTEDHYFVSPVLLIKPTKTTEIMIDGEYGEQDRKGISWKSLRSVASNFINWDGGEAGSFLQVPGKNPKTFRWSGPDTYNENTASNVQVKLTQKLAEDFYLLVGANRGTFDYEQLDNMASLELATNRANAPAWAIGTVDFSGIAPDIPGITTGPNPAVIPYQWERKREDNTTEQIRAELNYKFELFEDSPRKWLRSTHSFLAGYTRTTDETERHTWQTPGDAANYHNPTDPSYFRFGVQGDGATPDVEMRESKNQIFETKNPAFYGVYQGRLFDERVTLIVGARRDKNSDFTWRYNPEYRADGSVGGDTEATSVRSEETSETTYQFGVSVRVLRGLSVYAMKSEGVQPNFNGYVDFRGVPITAALAENKEVGMKVDFFDGRVSGTISRFQITRERSPIGNPSSVWYAPVLTAQNRFDPASNIVYNVSQWNPATTEHQAALNAQAQWDAAVAAGAIYQATNSAGNTNWYVNASSGAGATFMDTVFENVYTTNTAGWFGWIYDQDNLTNNATLDYNGGSPAGPIGNTAVALGSDRAEGWDAQLILSPVDNLQLVMSWAHITKRVLNAGGWIQYPYPEDRWAVWYFPATWAGLGGLRKEEVYENWEDTSTRISAGSGLAVDDTPRNQGSFWIHYALPNSSRLKGLSLAVGGNYEGPRQYFSGITHGGGAVIPGDDGDPLTLETDSRFQVDAMVKYAFTIRDKDASVQLNVTNVADTQKLYGLIYQAPRTFRVEFNTKF